MKFLLTKNYTWRVGLKTTLATSVLSCKSKKRKKKSKNRFRSKVNKMRFEIIKFQKIAPVFFFLLLQLWKLVTKVDFRTNFSLQFLTFFRFRIKINNHNVRKYIPNLRVYYSNRNFYERKTYTSGEIKLEVKIQ